MFVGRYIKYFGRLPHLLRPRTFTDKLLVRILFDRDPRLPFFADKVAVRDYVSARLGGTEHLTALYAVVDEPSQIRDLELPPAYAMKPNHLSGAVKLVTDGSSVDRAELEALAGRWLRRDYFRETGEWAYRNIRPRIMFEELLDPGGMPVDYKFHCFNGEPRYLSLISGRFSGGPLMIDIHDMDFGLVSARFADEPPSTPQRTTPPPNWRHMVEIARTLAAGTEFIRVDLYNIDGRIVFGELTNYPGSGLLKFIPPVWDRTYGDHWRRQ